MYPCICTGMHSIYLKNETRDNIHTDIVIEKCKKCGLIKVKYWSLNLATHEEVVKEHYINNDEERFIYNKLFK